MENRTESRIKFFAKSARGEQRERRAVLTEGVGKGVAGKKFWKNRKKQKKHLHSVSDCAIINKSPGDSDRQKKIRVWRSLVSRLNGVQEALSSNLNTRTIMWRQKRCLLRKARLYRAFLLPKRRFFSVPKHRCKIAVFPLWIDLNSRKVNIRYTGR